MKKDSLNIIEIPGNILCKENTRLSTLVFKVVTNKGKVAGLVTGDEIKRLLAEHGFQIEDKAYGEIY